MSMRWRMKIPLPMLTIPAPAQFLEQMVMPFAMENTRKYYPNTEKLAEDLAIGYRKVIADVYAAGCRNLQFDDCSWGMLVDPRACLIFDTDEKGLEAIKEQMLAANNLAMEGKPADLVINTHVAAATSTAPTPVPALMTA